MKIQYRHQKFQADAAKAVVDVFAGQQTSRFQNSFSGRDCRCHWKSTYNVSEGS